MHIDFFPVVVTARPTAEDWIPVDYDPAAVRIARASEVEAGDLVLGCFPDGLDMARVDYHVAAYLAAPVPHDPTCNCYGHAALDLADLAGPLVVLTDGFPWDVCDVMPAETLILIVPNR
jgi:hypothetical protein